MIFTMRYQSQVYIRMQMFWELERLSGVLTPLLLSLEAPSPCWLLR
jgi:hypothetical protein